MSGGSGPRAALQAAMVRAIAGAPTVADRLNGVFDAPPVRAARPHAIVEEPVASGWDAALVEGREMRVVVLIRDAGAEPVALRGLVEAVERAVIAMPAALGDGWRVLSRVVLRSRIQREAADRWQASAEFRLRTVRPRDEHQS